MSKDPATLISAYKKRQQMGPFIMWGLAALLVFIGVVILVVWLTGDSGPKMTLFATETPTPTLTYTPTATNTPTETPTVTSTPTETLTPTPSSPFEYTVQEGDYLASIAEKFELGPDGIPLLLFLNPGIDPSTQIVFVGQKIYIPNPSMQLPTATPIPTDLKKGTEISYTVQSGDTLASIAAQFNSSEEEIIKLNEIEDPNLIFVGQILRIPVNLVTPAPTATASPSATATP